MWANTWLLVHATGHCPIWLRNVNLPICTRLFHKKKWPWVMSHVNEYLTTCACPQSLPHLTSQCKPPYLYKALSQKKVTMSHVTCERIPDYLSHVTCEEIPDYLCMPPVVAPFDFDHAPLVRPDHICVCVRERESVCVCAYIQICIDVNMYMCI